EAADRQPRPGEWLPVNHLLRHPQLETDRAHLVLEQVAQRLNQLEAEARRQTADVVMGLDLGGGRGHVRRRGLDDVWVEGALGEEVDAAEARRLGFEHRYELASDDSPFLLRIDDSAQRAQKPVGGVYV